MENMNNSYEQAVKNMPKLKPMVGRGIEAALATISKTPAESLIIAHNIVKLEKQYYASKVYTGCVARYDD